MKKKSLAAKKKIRNSILNNLRNKRIKKIFYHFKIKLEKSLNNKPKIAVAISGGPDSLALAFLAKCFSLTNNLNSMFFIVDHKLRKESSREAKLVKLLLKKYGINCKILEWKGKKPNSNIQSIARNERYNLLKATCKKNNISHLLVGHHIDDLYENFFIRLLRGSGLKGMISFDKVSKHQNINLIRPLIKFSKKDLEYVTKKVFGNYVEDPSNKNIEFKRVKIRNFIKSLEYEGLNKDKFNLTIKN